MMLFMQRWWYKSFIQLLALSTPHNQHDPVCFHWPWLQGVSQLKHAEWMWVQKLLLQLCRVHCHVWFWTLNKTVFPASFCLILNYVWQGLKFLKKNTLIVMKQKLKNIYFKYGWLPPLSSKAIWAQFPIPHYKDSHRQPLIDCMFSFGEAPIISVPRGWGPLHFSVMISPLQYGPFLASTSTCSHYLSQPVLRFMCFYFKDLISITAPVGRHLYLCFFLIWKRKMTAMTSDTFGALVGQKQSQPEGFRSCSSRINCY